MPRRWDARPDKLAPMAPADPPKPTVTKPPFLFVDLYPFDFDDPRTPQLEDPPWAGAFAHPELHGFILKATDGVQYAYTSWFVKQFATLAKLVGAERGVTKFLGGYHYAQFMVDGTQQGDVYTRVLTEAGWGARDIVPIIDVEAGGERSANRRASAQQVVDCVSKIAERVRVNTGRRVMLYGRGLMRDLEIHDRMGCDQVWNPSYTAKMVTNGLLTIGSGRKGPWDLGDIPLWQYGGDGVGDSSVTGLPLGLSGWGKTDISVFIDGSREPTMERVRARLL